MNRLPYVAVFLVLAATGVIAAVPRSVELSLVPAAPRTGAIVSFRLAVLLPDGVVPVSLTTNRSESDIVVSPGPPQKQVDPSGNLFVWEGRIQVFELEAVRFPGFLLLTRDATGKVDERTVAAFYMPVGVFPVDLERTPPIRGPRGPLEYEEDGALPWPLFVALLVLSAGLVFFFRRRRGKTAPQGMLVPGEDPWVTVERRLLQMLERVPQDSDAEKEDYFLATELVRFLLGSRTGLAFPEATTSEIAVLASRVDWLDTGAVTRLILLFQQGDLVKFAKFRPEPGDREHYLRDLLEWCRLGEERRTAQEAAAAEGDGDGI